MTEEDKEPKVYLIHSVHDVDGLRFTYTIEVLDEEKKKKVLENCESHVILKYCPICTQVYYVTDSPEIINKCQHCNTALHPIPP